MLLYLAFLYVLSVRHRDDFVEPSSIDARDVDARHAELLWINVGCLLAGLIAAVLRAERFVVGVEDGLAGLGLQRPDAIIGALILGLALGLVSFGTGRTNVLTGLVHVVVWFAYLMLLFVPERIANGRKDSKFARPAFSGRLFDAFRIGRAGPAWRQNP
ncbi:MAG: hypothetical protein ABI277_15615 [Burkholderiaceae bacterium]